MAYEFKVNKLSFTTDDVCFEPPALTLFIGPNNAGKSTALKEIRAAILNENDYYCIGINEDKRGTGRVFSEIGLPRPLSLEELDASTGIKDKICKDQHGNWKNIDCCGSSLRYTFLNGALQPSQLSKVTYGGTPNWKDMVESWISERALGPGTWDRASFFSFIGPSLVNYLGTEDRLLLSLGEHYYGRLDSEANYLSSTVMNEALYEQLSEETLRQFGKRVYPDIHSSGGALLLRTCVSRDYDFATDGYLRDEGDGFRSFVITFLTVFGSDRPVLLLDEPEAFLHPPQARRLGEIIGKRAKEGNSQLFIATHSRDILEGIISSRCEAPCIVRLSRVNNKQCHSFVDAASIGSVLTTSLRFTNILNALFASNVLLVEGPDDVVFFDALGLSLGYSDRPLGVAALGKTNFKNAVEFLSSAKIPFIFEADFDVIKNKDHYASALDQLVANEEERRGVHQCFKGIVASISQAVGKESNKSFKPYSSQPFLYAGEHLDRFNDLQCRLLEEGYWVLSTGELESTMPGINDYSSNKSSWLARALEIFVDPSRVDEVERLKVASDYKKAISFLNEMKLI